MKPNTFASKKKRTRCGKFLSEVKAVVPLAGPRYRKVGPSSAGRVDALLHRSDQGPHYSSANFQRLPLDNGIICSLSRQRLELFGDGEFLLVVEG